MSPVPRPHRQLRLHAALDEVHAHNNVVDGSTTVWTVADDTAIFVRIQVTASLAVYTADGKIAALQNHARLIDFEVDMAVPVGGPCFGPDKQPLFASVHAAKNVDVREVILLRATALARPVPGTLAGPNQIVVLVTVTFELGGIGAVALIAPVAVRELRASEQHRRIDLTVARHGRVVGPIVAGACAGGIVLADLGSVDLEAGRSAGRLPERTDGQQSEEQHRRQQRVPSFMTARLLLRLLSFQHACFSLTWFDRLADRSHRPVETCAHPGISNGRTLLFFPTVSS